MAHDEMHTTEHDKSAPSFADVDQGIRQQDREAEEFAAAFLRRVIRIRGVKIERSAFLRQELHKAHLGDELIDRAIGSTPLQAGVPFSTLDAIATSAIAFETNKSAAMSFAAGLPGGFAMAAAVPADITQYYVHAFRVMQKLAYVYGWQDFLNDLEDIDDETLGKLSLFLGVMMGVSGASAGLTKFAQQIARPALQKQIAQQALTKTAWYGPMKQVLRMIGIKVTKDSFAKTVTKAVPVAGGVISGGMTFVSLKLQSERLMVHLRELPPPGVNSAEHRGAIELTAGETIPGGKVTAASNAIGGAVDGSKETVKQAARDAKGAVSRGAGRARGVASSLFAKAARRGQEADMTYKPEDPLTRDAKDSEAERDSRSTGAMGLPHG